MRQNILVKVGFFVAVAITFLFVWHAVSQSSENLWLVLPSPLKIAGAFYERSDRIFYHAIATVDEMLGSLLIALITCLPLVLAMVRFQLVGLTVQTLFILFQSIPTFCLAPLMVLWFGWGYTVIVLPTALMMLFPLTLSIYKGFQAVPTSAIEYFKVNQATPLQLFFKLQLPYALPYFFSGLRIALAISGMGAIAGEWSGADRGLGVLMIESRQSLELEMTFAALFTVVAITLSFYIFGIFCEKRCWDMYRFALKVKNSSLKSLVFLLTLSILSCTSCREPQPKKPTANLRSINLMLDWLPNPNHVPFYVGSKLNFFADEGYDLHIYKAITLDPLQPLAAKQMDLVISYFPRTVCAVSKGAKMKIVGKLIQEPLDCFIVLDDSEIHTPKDFAHKTIGLSDSHFTSSYLDTIFKDSVGELPKRQNVNFDLTSALLTKQVDAIYGAFWNIEMEQIAELGKKARYFTVADFGVPTYDELVIVAYGTTEFATKEKALRFQNALQKSIDFCLEHPDEAIEIYFAQNLDKGKVAKAWEKKAWEQTLKVLARSQTFSQEKVNAHINWLSNKGIIATKPEIQSFIEN